MVRWNYPAVGQDLATSSNTITPLHNRDRAVEDTMKRRRTAAQAPTSGADRDR